MPRIQRIILRHILWHQIEWGGPTTITVVVYNQKKTMLEGWVFYSCVQFENWLRRRKKDFDTRSLAEVVVYWSKHWMLMQLSNEKKRTYLRHDKARLFGSLLSRFSKSRAPYIPEKAEA